MERWVKRGLFYISKETIHFRFFPNKVNHVISLPSFIEMYSYIYGRQVV